MNEPENEPSDIWPPQPTIHPKIRPSVTEIGRYRVQVTPDCLIVRNPPNNLGWIVTVLVALYTLFLTEDYLNSRLGHPGFRSETADELLHQIIVWTALLVISIAFTYSAMASGAKILIADRPSNTLQVQGLWVGSYFALQSLEIRLASEQMSGRLYLVLTDPLEPTGTRQEVVTAEKREDTLRQLADAVAEFAGVPVAVK